MGSTGSSPTLPCTGPSKASLAGAVTRLHRGKGSETQRLGALVVTIRSGVSFDALFHEVPQMGPAGTYVATYEVLAVAVETLYRAIESGIAPSSLGDDGRELVNQFFSAEPRSVVFNWECCGGCQNEDFGEMAHTLPLLRTLLRRGIMAMFSDFSLKALIEKWDKRALGPNPFLKIGEFSESMRLTFEPEQLMRCPSAQLQALGQICNAGFVEVDAMSSTIAYTVDGNVAATTPAYKLEVLTVASGMRGVSLPSAPHLLCQSGKHRGSAGHVLMTYPSGGLLLTSAGHWIDLTRLDVSEERLLSMASTTYGEEYSSGLRSRLESCSTGIDRDELSQCFAKRYIQGSSPGQYSSGI
eukprot:NODE_10161_length_1372_cov_8.123695.p1 GENE.NODE_10161_length_1372_cov_8.123695~~NODE_10161_length_1372_cov_8.123695.p1  ORF type:complete len:355 (-),score=81.72 NODE_10161_length_1372_cov_8.123695:213-1277(-)